MIPGSNLLGAALRLIGKQQFIYFRYLSRVSNDEGILVPSYANGIYVNGSVQPVPKTLYEFMGLDYQKNYYNFFVPGGIIDVARNVSGDQFSFNGARFQCQSKTDWEVIDGWTAVLCVQIPD